MDTIPNKLDNRMRDAEQAWAAVLAAKDRVARAIKTDTLTSVLALQLVTASHEYDRQIGGFING
jgi:hypothetical protein